MASTLNAPVIAVVEDTDVPFKLAFGAAASCFVGALATDIVYTQAPDMVWVTFSAWLITIGLILALVAVILGAIDRLVHHRFGALTSRWVYILGFAAVSIVEIFNAFVHSRDAWQAVVPDGITLSVVAVALLVLTAILGRAHFRSRTRKSF